MASMVFLDGAVVPLAHARVPVTDRGFLWGDHVFEVVRTAGGHPCDGAAHLDRLAVSASRIGLAPPDRPAIELAVAAVIAAAGEPTLAIRIIVTAGDGRRLGERTGPQRLVIFAEPLEPGPATPVRLAVLRMPRVAGLLPADAKTGNYLASILALAAAARAGADDVVFVDEGRALETAGASLFVVAADGGIATPTGALLPGVTAARVAALLANQGHPVRHGPVAYEDLVAATELFTTSARRGVVAVGALDGAIRTEGPFTRLAREHYDAWIRGVATGQGTRLAL